MAEHRQGKIQGASAECCSEGMGHKRGKPVARRLEEEHRQMYTELTIQYKRLHFSLSSANRWLYSGSTRADLRLRM